MKPRPEGASLQLCTFNASHFPSQAPLSGAVGAFFSKFGGSAETLGLRSFGG